MNNLPVGKRIYELDPKDQIEVEEFRKDYWDKSRDRETHSIDDLSKYLWISNGSGVTISFGLFQSKGVLTECQFWGSTSFVVGIVTLLLMKILSEYVSSRDRSRFQRIYGEFINGEITSDELGMIRDKKTVNIGRSIGILRYLSCITFIIGISLFLYSYKNSVVTGMV